MSVLILERGVSMERIRNFSQEWILVPSRRYRLFAWISFGFMFLFPLLGWNPLLILWTVNACLSCREACHSKMRYLHVAMALVFLAMILINFSMFFYVLLQYFGYFM